MNGLAEILRTGKAPGFNQKTLDPGHPRRAIPRALKELEQHETASRIARAAGFGVNKLKKVWKI
jgi:hypothetical protein